MIFMRDNRTQKELIKKLPIGTVLKLFMDNFKYNKKYL